MFYLTPPVTPVPAAMKNSWLPHLQFPTIPFDRIMRVQAATACFNRCSGVRLVRASWSEIRGNPASRISRIALASIAAAALFPASPGKGDINTL